MFPGRGPPNGFHHGFGLPPYLPDFHRVNEGWVPQDCPQAANWDLRHGRCDEGFGDMWNSPFSRDINPYHADFYGGDEGRYWAPEDCQQPARWENQRGRHEEGFTGGWHSPFSRDIEPYPVDLFGGDEGRCWASQDHQQPARWENQRGRHEERFEDGWHSAVPLNQRCLAAVSREEHGSSWDRQESAGKRGHFPRKYCGRGRKHHHGPFRGSYRGKFTSDCRRFHSGSNKEKFKASESSASSSSKSHSEVQLEASQEATAPPSPAGSVLAIESSASPETTEGLNSTRTEEVQLASLVAESPLEQQKLLDEIDNQRFQGRCSFAAPIFPSPHCPVQLGADLETADNHCLADCTLVTDSILAEAPEELCLPEEEIPLVQLEASHEDPEPPATPETTEDLQPIRAEVELLQLEEPLKAPDLLSQAASALTTSPPVLSELTQELPPVGKEETELEQLDASQADVDSSHHACSALATQSETMEDLRSAAILARKEEIELSYQRYCLAFAVLSALLLQKEPSMEVSMGSALRANLRQVGGYCLQELERFISSYDAGSASS